MLRLWATVGHRTVIFRRPELLSVTARNSSTTRVSYQIITTMSTLESKGTKDYRGWVLWERFELEPRAGEEADQQFWVYCSRLRQVLTSAVSPVVLSMVRFAAVRLADIRIPETGWPPFDR